MGWEPGFISRNENKAEGAKDIRALMQLWGDEMEDPEFDTDGEDDLEFDVANRDEANNTPAMLKKLDLLDRIVARSGLKRRDAKLALEATLSELRTVLEIGHELSVPPLGRVRIVKTKTLEGGASLLTLKVRTARQSAKKPRDVDVEEASGLANDEPTV